MKINNLFVSASLTNEHGYNLGERYDDIIELRKLADYSSRVDAEPIWYDEDFWRTDLGNGQTLSDQLYSPCADCIEKQAREMMLRLINERMAEAGADLNVSEHIDVSLGTWPRAAGTLAEYLTGRRVLLSRSLDVGAYEKLLPSCFPNLIFAEKFLHRYKSKEFSSYRGEIIECLSVLNDDTMERLQDGRYSKQKIIHAIEAATHRPVGMDPNHRSDLMFSFALYDSSNMRPTGEMIEVCCEPHLKLLQDNSDLRIYFNLDSRRIGCKDKILIGRIGGHPY